jgi:NAD(P)H-quinone oxidoreductase subunit 5
METLSESTLAALIAATTPGLMGFAAPRIGRLGARPSRALGVGAAAVAALAALVAAGACAVYGTATGQLLGLALPGGLELGVGARVDGLTAVMLVTVTAIGFAVTRYAVRYLDGDSRQAAFSQWLSYTLSAVLLVIVSSNLAMLFAGWIATSHGLHRLLTHFGDRPAALLAARKKFLTSRLGDVLLLLAFALVVYRFGSLEFAEIFPRAAAAPEGEVLPIALLLVLGAMTKSAQFPFHTWLPDSLETPTPVSALMHAGIINAGGFLLVRMSPLLAAAPAALVPLALGGAFTALLGSVAMLAQSDIKRKYAWSTVSQMGFMMLQCGLGAFAAATLHIVGHAFYKGHAFLSSGSAVDPEPPRQRGPKRPATVIAMALSLVSGFAVVGLAALLMGIDPVSKPGLPVLGSILALATAQLLLTSTPQGGRAVAASLAAGAGISVASFSGVVLFERILGAAIPAAPPPFAGGPWLATALVACFGLAFVFQHRLAVDGAGRLARATWVHASHGFYLGALQNRVVERLWPLPQPNPVHAEGVRR